VTTTETPQLERASTAAPRPELDWERDWQGRPRVLADPTWTAETAPPGWVVGGQLLPEREYTRVTTFAEALQDSSALTRWKMRRAVLGMGRRPDYVVTAASLTAEDRDRDALDDLAEKALEASGPNAADVGTALHAFTDRIDRGEELGQVPEQYRSTLDAYTHAVSVLRFMEWECRTVCDELGTGGTPDRLGFCSIPDPDGETEPLRIIDTKTGRVDYSAGKFSTQLGIYRRSRKYHPGTGVRTSWEELHGHPVSRWGLVVHVPAGAGTAELLWIDLEHGEAGAEIALQVRAWRQGATSGRLLRPVFARPPRPATTDGTCRGRKQDGTACGYRRKAKDPDPLVAQFCGRHTDQAAQLQRWLEENPDTDPASGVEEEPSRKPVQPSSPAVVAVEAAAASDAAQRAADAAVGTPAEAALSAVAGAAAAAADAAEAVPGAALQLDRPAPADSERTTPEQDAAYLAGDLICWRAMPNGWLLGSPGQVAVTPDGVRWVKVQRTDAYGWEREERVLAAGGPEHVTCSRTSLPVTQCACSVHRPDLVSTAAAVAASDPAAAAMVSASEIAQQLQEEQTRPARELPDALTVKWPGRRADDDYPQEDDEAAADGTDQLDGDDSYPDHGPEDDAAAAMGLPSQTVGTEELQQQMVAGQWYTANDEPAPQGPVGTYALDPATEQNGNRRPVSGLQTPEDAAHALRTARAALFDQIDACVSETELQLLYRMHASIWTQPHTDRAGARSRQLMEQRAREKPEAALLAALETAPDHATLTRLWSQYPPELWSPEAHVLARTRWEQLSNMAQL
jgi:hypothetical protein